MSNFSILHLCRLFLFAVVLNSTVAYSAELSDGCDLNNDGQVSGVKEQLCEKERENIQKQMKIRAIEKALAEAEQRLKQLNKEIAKTEQKKAR